MVIKYLWDLAAIELLLDSPRFENVEPSRYRGFCNGFRILFKDFHILQNQRKDDEPQHSKSVNCHGRTGCKITEKQF